MTKGRDDDPFGAKAARDAALERVLWAGGRWKDVALRYISLLRRGWRGTGEQLRLAMLRNGCPFPHHHNAWGAVINRAIVDHGYLRGTGRYAHMETEKSHARRTE